MAIANSATLRRPSRAQSVDAVLMERKQSGLRDLGQEIRSRMEFLDDRVALRLLGISAIMATGLLAVSLGIASVIVRFGLN